MSVTNFVILLLSLTTVTFFVLFWIYYNSVDSFMKDKETQLINKERELNVREQYVSTCEQNLHKMNNYKDSLVKIKGILDASLNA
jgi:hypothetical protein